MARGGELSNWRHGRCCSAWFDQFKGTGGGKLGGWAKEEGHLASPWEWPGFEVHDEAAATGGFRHDDADAFARYLKLEGPRPPDSPFYQALIDKLDNRDNRISEQELDTVLRNRSQAGMLGRLIVRHASGWTSDQMQAQVAVAQCIAEQLGPVAQDCVKEETPRAEKLRWWDDVAGKLAEFPTSPVVYHFHPGGVAGCFARERHEITVAFLEEISGKTGDWFSGKGGGKLFEQAFITSYPDIYHFSKPEFVDLLNEALVRHEISGAYEKAHFISQCFHECAHFETTIEFGSGRNYDPGIHPDAIKNGNTEVGDGPRYRGRGLIQLTWKNNYKKYSAYRGIDFTANPDSIAKDMFNSIDASCWFWRKNGGIHKKHNAGGDINKLIAAERNNVELVTLAVNGGNNGLAERRIVFERVKHAWGLE